MEDNVVKSKPVRQVSIRRLLKYRLASSERAKLKLEIQVNVQEENVVEVQVAPQKKVTEA
jgi:hypothetical protein